MTAPFFLREVDGQLYDIRYSQLWHNLSGQIIDKNVSGIVLQTFTTNRTYRTSGADVTSGESVGMGAPGPFSGPSTHISKIEVLPDKTISVRNYQPGHVGQFITVRAMMISGLGQMETWDCGLSHKSVVLVTNQISVPASNRVSTIP